MTIVENEFALPAPLEESSPRLDYVRSKCDPRILISTKSGDNFTRRDGAFWEWPGWKLTRNSRGKVECEPATGIEDTVVYRDDEAITVEHLLPSNKRPRAA